MATARLKLVGSRASPFARKARIVAAEKRIEFTWEIQNPWASDSTVSELNPLGKVPVLVLDDGTALYDSRVICEFLDGVSPIGKLIPAGNRERIEVRRWEALADGVVDAAALARTESQRPAHERSASWTERQMKKVTRGLDALESQLGARAFCCGNTLTLADIAVGACLGWLDFRYPKLGWRDDRPNLERLAAKLAERPSFADTVPAD
ncbi:MAG TPA: glutathione S-transferase [Burkholderiales bacterium]|nr:glutathione S-transferase [Burkholderiales bacterium]